ncbi:hypothetical protein GQ600_7718 [Phytophthora cactorum]|nr:hypothetical protein GQ600_7718 [Phytophthora cactorum]
MRNHLDVVLFLQIHRPEDFSFLAADCMHYSCMELIELVLHHYADKVDRCEFEVPTWDWRFNEWCAKMNLQRVRGDISSTWWVCESASLRSENVAE